MTFSARIAGLGTCVPERRISQAEALARSTGYVCEDRRQKRLLRMLFQKSGVEFRHSAVSLEELDQWSTLEAGASTGERMRCFSEQAPPLARQAAGAALTDAAVTASDISHLVTVSCTGFDAPGIDLNLFESLELRPTQRVHVGFMGCHGALNGLRVARGLLAAEPQSRVLLCAVELCSLHYRYQWDDEGIIGNALFADGAAAMVLDDPQTSEEPDEPWKLSANGSCVLPDSHDSMSWTIGDFGFEMRLTSVVPDAIQKHLAGWMAAWLDRVGLARDDIESWIIHPGGPRILDAVQEALQLSDADMEESRGVLRDYGNMSSPTVLFILERLRRQDAKRPCVVLGFGPGLVAEAALLM